ncbi:MAG TPA: GNAT family N-acetyltransferase [Micromonosporaceae bacterium]
MRRAEPRDLPAIVGLLAADQLGATRDGGDLAPYRRAFDAIDADPAQLLVVVDADPAPGMVDAGPEPGMVVDGPEPGGPVVATMQVTFIPGLARRGALRAQIEAVRVRADHRRYGLGAAMVGWAVDEAHRRGCALVQLTSDKSRQQAHRFYRRLGFVDSHEGFKLHLPPPGG